ncbi:hypothetical protein [Herbiconiux flava]|uniref:tRNA-guanine(15) transglycosylase-like domain-containing protein n=1 Tax=Herbiconiux flava TaxID=881268 RepID=A0A852SP34_9MICO|nr:hypothetical protein [Herbiconiux flava]NYD70565.1 hypothetical protein [Herbiconiux flava]GLK17320.1 hypothetical protein GCM10017602_18020 [Herbiconiux flava]
MSTIEPNNSGTFTQPVVAPARPTARDVLRSRVLTISGCDGAEAMSTHLSTDYEGLVITGADRHAKMRRIRRIFADILLIAEPDSHMHHESTPDALWYLPAEGEGLFPAPTLEDVLDAQRTSGASIALLPSGFIDVGDTETLRATVEAANAITGTDLALPLYLASAWLRPEHKAFLIAVIELSDHPVLLSFGSSTNPLDSNRKLALHREVLAETGALAWRTDLAGLEALAYGALGAAIGASPSSRRFTPPKNSGKARRPDDPTPYVLIPGHMHWMKTHAMQEELYVGVPAPTCSCRECNGQRIDRFTDKQKDAAARHNHAVIDAYVMEIHGAAPMDRPSIWHGRVHDAVVAHETTAALVGRPWKAPDDITAWSGA